MFKILVLIVVEKNIYKMQHLVGSGTPVLYIGRTVLKDELPSRITTRRHHQSGATIHCGHCPTAQSSSNLIVLHSPTSHPSSS
jgi:hypothetical protein